MKVTISDVARLAGVSTATVSHTINNTRYVSAETKDKVYKAIAELGYTPDASARSISRMQCPVLQLDGTRPVEENLQAIFAYLHL